MKIEVTDLSEIRKSLFVEVPSEQVEREIDRLSQRYRQSVKLPGFRPGKAPIRLIRQRLRDQILHEAAQGIVPRAVDEALRERGLQPVDTPSIRDLTIEEGQPLTFTANFETLPAVDPGEYHGLTLRRSPVEVKAEDVDKALEQLRESAARAEPVEGRGAATGDVLQVDLTRTIVRQPAATSAPSPATRQHEDVEIELGATANPPGFDEHLVGAEPGATREFTLTYPDPHDVAELAGAEVAYVVSVKAIRQRVLPALDDDFARDLGAFDSLDALRDRVREDLTARAEHESERRLRDELLRQLASRVPGDVPEALVEREVDRRVEALASQLMSQRIDPRRANIDWDRFRDEQRAAATDTVRSALVLDAIARAEQIEVTDADLDAEVSRRAEQSGRTASAMRALIEKEGGVRQLTGGLRREKAIDFVLTHATIITA